MAVAANAYARLARFDDCAREAERVKRLATAMAPVPSEVRVAVMFAELWPVIRVGRDLPGVEAVLLAARQEAAATCDRTLQTGGSMMLGMLELRRGHAVDALAYFDENADALTEADAGDNALFAATLHAKALASCGDPVRAQAQLEELGRMAQAHPRSARSWPSTSRRRGRWSTAAQGGV